MPSPNSPAAVRLQSKPRPSACLLQAWFSVLLVVQCLIPAHAASQPSLSGIYPHLAMFNPDGECGTGAVVPWADRLWVITYAPHKPTGSADKLYEITADLTQIIRPESVGGTSANRMIHRESGQLFIGPYVIDGKRQVRVLTPDRMPGRLTGNARHLTDPARWIYVATMEEGFYEVNVHTLEARELYPDANRDQQRLGSHAGPLLPGYHGKGLYSAQGRMVYANNGEYSPAAMSRPETPSGCLAEWDGHDWRVVRRQQFTDVTGPGGLEGNRSPEDPLWSIGWDHRSLILMLLDRGTWHSFRLPKSSHSYDGAHGWNTEWPRIRDIGRGDWLMTMHGAFWRFPRRFRIGATAGIIPESNYLKVIGDFARWGDRIVFGCDDTAKAEFLNKRRAKGEISPPQSQSNLWFVRPGAIDDFGPVLGRGGLWMKEDIAADVPSEPFLIAGYDRRGLHLSHGGSGAVTVRVEVDARGDGAWRRSRELQLGPKDHRWVELTETGTWLRLVAPQPIREATAWFQFSNEDRRSSRPASIFDGLARPSSEPWLGGWLLPLDRDRRTLAISSVQVVGAEVSHLGTYELHGNLELRPIDPAAAPAPPEPRVHARMPTQVVVHDGASILFVDDQQNRWRLPVGDPSLADISPVGYRVDREVATERDLFNAGGTFFELPAENAGGFAKVRPVATHNLRIHDYCSYRGLLVMTGVDLNRAGRNRHILRSTDGKAAVWAGVIDDVWKLGKPRGTGGPWKRTAVAAGIPSDPYLLTGYDQKRISFSHESPVTLRIRVEIDVTGTGIWTSYATFDVPPGSEIRHVFPRAFSAYWLRVTSDHDGLATVQLQYD
ncbi:MAG: hypothetical protein JNK85_14050 [Verrucomicrobiales bacterium]|nr:hypothetical protein [Verrucomicrobiales bacterium]